MKTGICSGKMRFEAWMLGMATGIGQKLLLEKVLDRI